VYLLETSGEVTVTIVEQGGGPAPQAAPDLIKETTTQTFVKDVIEESKRQPVLIDFWAPWCGPCKSMAPHFELAAQRLPRVRFAKLDTDAHPKASVGQRIRSIPTLVLYRGGQELARRSGATTAPDIVRWVQGQIA
jgi:putative thioredoxin